MERVLDVRGLRCPLPLIRTKLALEGMAAGEFLVVRATDPEAPIDIGAWADGEGIEMLVEQDQDCWLIALRR